MQFSRRLEVFVLSIALLNPFQLMFFSVVVSQLKKLQWFLFKNKASFVFKNRQLMFLEDQKIIFVVS